MVRMHGITEQRQPCARDFAGPLKVCNFLAPAQRQRPGPPPSPPPCAWLACTSADAARSCSRSRSASPACGSAMPAIILSFSDHACKGGRGRMSEGGQGGARLGCGVLAGACLDMAGGELPRGGQRSSAKEEHEPGRQIPRVPGARPHLPETALNPHLQKGCAGRTGQQSRPQCPPPPREWSHPASRWPGCPCACADSRPATSAAGLGAGRGGAAGGRAQGARLPRPRRQRCCMAGTPACSPPLHG